LINFLPHFSLVRPSTSDEVSVAAVTSDQFSI